MKAIGIEISNKRVIAVAIEKKSDQYENLNPTFKYLEIKDGLNNQNLRDFKNSIFSLFDEINPSKIAIVARQTKGKFAASSVSFKLEAIMQCYSKVEVEIISKPTINAFYKKNDLEIPFNNNYQEQATRLVNYILNT